ncbi:hypothetical protein ACQKMD_09100 [Viridibacillus sp. NPDC096237]|uniref:hypothetical protein n=1 Tax=Viridibacillus sp. NPDC096237 TaxID=3390721 RepID=UPI003D024C3B
MAGYIFTLDSFDSLKEIIKNGIYSTNLKITNKNTWGTHHEGTFADYLSMSEGDNVYFFIKRKIYGVGKLINISGGCKILNFPDADFPQCKEFGELKNQMVLNKTQFNLGNRFICTFEGAPNFYKQGIDMDDVLESNPRAFKMLRVLWKLSFIKIDDIENKALLDVILKSNESKMFDQENIFDTSILLHDRLRELYNERYKVTSENILENASSGDSIKHEMAIEAGIIDYIKNNPNGKFGNWDYLSHQVVASPFKPVDYMDKMDIFGYKFIPSFNTVSKYLVLEIKKDNATVDVIHQVMKYVDWVNQENAYGDYDMIEAFIVAKNFPVEVIELKNSIGRRVFTKGRRPPKTSEWFNLKLMKYSYNKQLKKLLFEEVE